MNTAKIAEKARFAAALARNATIASGFATAAGSTVKNLFSGKPGIAAALGSMTLFMTSKGYDLMVTGLQLAATAATTVLFWLTRLAVRLTGTALSIPKNLVSLGLSIFGAKDAAAKVRAFGVGATKPILNVVNKVDALFDHVFNYVFGVFKRDYVKKPMLVIAGVYVALILLSVVTGGASAAFLASIGLGGAAAISAGGSYTFLAYAWTAGIALAYSAVMDVLKVPFIKHAEPVVYIVSEDNAVTRAEFDQLVGAVGDLADAVVGKKVATK